MSIIDLALKKIFFFLVGQTKILIEENQEGDGWNYKGGNKNQHDDWRWHNKVVSTETPDRHGFSLDSVILYYVTSGQIIQFVWLLVFLHVKWGW